ncbi:MAG TPA: MBL fold metallo-hydrolase, partial [Chloroflexota bacterium]
ATSVAVDRALAGGDTFAWEQYAIQVVATPGHTDGSLSYVVDCAGRRVAFVGDLLYGEGQFWELWSLQGPPPDDLVGMHDYHAFCGRGRQAVASLERLLQANAPDVLVPAHGPLIRDPAAALAALRRNLEALLANYYHTSSMRYYFPDWTARQMPATSQEFPGRLAAPPAWYRVVRGTMRTIVAASGRAVVFDCPAPAAAAEITRWITNGTISGVDAVWISHYHDDHVGGIAALVEQTGCAVWAHRGLADVLTRPDAYALPCLDPTVIKPDRLLEEGERIDWQEFTVSAYDFPGQTLLHSALLVERDGTRLLIGGDSFTPGGLDDYCVHNRNLLGPGRGYECCLDLLEQLQPDLLVNMHVPLPFILPPAFLAEARASLSERARLLTALLPWEHPNCGLDPQWLRLYPYHQTLKPGSRGQVELQVSNSASTALEIRAIVNVPDGWQSPDGNGGLVAPESDGAYTIAFSLPANTAGGRYVLTAQVWVNGRNLGDWVEALVDVDAGSG